MSFHVSKINLFHQATPLLEVGTLCTLHYINNKSREPGTTTWDGHHIFQIYDGWHWDQAINSGSGMYFHEQY